MFSNVYFQVTFSLPLPLLLLKLPIQTKAHALSTVSISMTVLSYQGGKDNTAAIVERLALRKVPRLLNHFKCNTVVLISLAYTFVNNIFICTPG